MGSAMPETPIRVGFIGLNAKDSWATNAHLPYLKDTSKYKIVALLNSSEESARASIQSHGLPSDTKAYGSPIDLAADENVDLVVCSVRVDKHYPVLKPILQQGKMKAVHCEWPLGKNLAEAEELVDLARARGVKTIVGLQGRKSPIVHKTREVLESGVIGRILSVTVTAVGYNFGAADLESLQYLSDIDVGGNMVTIHFSHIFDTITQTVGQLDRYNCILETKRPETLLRDKPHSYRRASMADKPVKIVGSVRRTAHDQILLQGHLKLGELISFHMRGGQPFPGQPGLVWYIYGEDGELRITTPSANLHFGGPGHELWHHDHVTDRIRQIQLPQDEFDKKDLPWTARNPARVYEAFADGKEDEYADWEDALQRHRLVEDLYRQNKEVGLEQRRKMSVDMLGSSPRARGFSNMSNFTTSGAVGREIEPGFWKYSISSAVVEES